MMLKFKEDLDEDIKSDYESDILCELVDGSLDSMTANLIRSCIDESLMLTIVGSEQKGKNIYYEVSFDDVGLPFMVMDDHVDLVGD